MKTETGIWSMDIKIKSLPNQHLPGLKSKLETLEQGVNYVQN